MRQDSSQKDELESYMFARILDDHLQKRFKDAAKPVTYHTVQEAMRDAELEFADFDFGKFVEQLTNDCEWSLDYIYLDQSKTNKYSIELEYVERVSSSPVVDPPHEEFDKTVIEEQNHPLRK